MNIGSARIGDISGCSTRIAMPTATDGNPTGMVIAAAV